MLAPIPEKESEDEKQDIGIRQITEKQAVIKILFDLIPGKNRFIYKYYEKGTEITIDYDAENVMIQPIWNLISEIFELPQNYPQNSLTDETKKYIIRKLIKISHYPQYMAYLDETAILYKEKIDPSYAPSFESNSKKLHEYIKAIKEDDSHIAYKFKQAINYLKHYELFAKKEHFTINFSEDVVRLENYFSTKGLKEIDRIEFIPPPIFKPKIILSSSDGESDFEFLSSGEKQRIHTISSILYHIRNLNSIDSSKSGLISYSNVCLLLDEIELYYHPEMQREYLSFLLKMISKLPLENIDAINVCFITHSPFILSDIPNRYILFLDEQGVPKKRRLLLKHLARIFTTY